MLIPFAKQLATKAIDAINHLGVSETEEDLTSRAQLLSLVNEASFTGDTLLYYQGLGTSTPHSHPQRCLPELPSVDTALQNALGAGPWKRSEVVAPNLNLNSLRSSWLELSNANKDMCHKFWEPDWVIPQDFPAPPLFRSFALKPFRVDAADIPDTHFHGPLSRIFKSDITQEMKRLLESLLRSTEHRARNTSGHSLHDRLLLSLWCNTAQVLQKWGSDLSLLHRIGDENNPIASTEQLRAFIDLFDQGLRDSLFRRRRKMLSIAIVGLEASGKSSFLNYIIGRDLLLEDVGQATTYPCRIQHVPGQAVSKLTIDTAYLNKILALIRLKPIFQALKAVRWDGKSLLLDPRFSEEIRQWANFLRRRKVKETLAIIADPNFTLQGPFLGDDAVSTALQHANHIVSICHLLDIPFDSFSDSLWADSRCADSRWENSRWENSRWATITVEFGEVGMSDKPYELLDLPGLYGKKNQMYWQDLVRESIRHAKVIIPVVSALDVLSNKENAYVWRELPEMISSSTSVIPSAVVVTQSDRLPVYPKQDQATRFREIREEFWPEAIDPSLYPVFECSVLQGRSAGDLIHSIESPDKFHLATLWDSHASHALAVILNAESLEKAEARIQDVPLDQLKSSAIQLEVRGNMRETTQGILELAHKAASKETIREAQGIRRRILQLLDLLRDHLCESGLLNSEEMEALEAQNKLEQEQSSILIEWAEKEDLLLQDYQQFSIDTLKTLDKKIEDMVLGAAEEWRQENDFLVFDTPEDSNRIYFHNEASVEAFVAFLRERLVGLQDEVLASAEDRIYSIKKEQFSDLAKKAGQLDARIEAPLVSLLSPYETKSLVPEIKLPNLNKDGLAMKQTISLRRNWDYTAIYKQTSAWIMRGQGHSTGKFSFLSRGFIGLAATLSYILSLPLSRKPEECPFHYVDLEAVLAVLQSAASTSWDDTMSQTLQRRLQNDAKRGRDLIESSTPFKAFDRLTARVMSPLQLDEGMQNIIIAGYLNLIGALASQQMMARGWS